MGSAAFSPAGYAGYFEITSDQLQVDEAVGNLYYDLALAPAGFWSAVESDGRSIRVVNVAGDTAYSFELVGFSQALAIGSLFFDSSFVLSAAVDSTWRIYAGNASATLPAASDPLGREGVYDANYKGVYHFAQDPSGTAPQIVDSTANHNDLTSQGAMTSGDLVDGDLDKALDLDGVDDSLIRETFASVTAPPFTIELRLLERTGTNHRSFFLGDKDVVDQYWNLRLDDGVVSFWAFDQEARAAGTATVGAWHNVVARAVSSSERHVYHAGGNKGSSLTTRAVSGSDRLAFGYAADSTPQGWYNGQLDAAWLSGADRSEAYITTRHNNLHAPGTFWTTGAWTPLSATGPGPFFFHRLVLPRGRYGAR